MFLQGLIWNFLKRLLVREGRSSRQDFILKGALPLFLALFGLLLIPAFPKFGDFGITLLIVSIFFSRAALAQAIRRSHDLDLPADSLVSFQRQVVAHLQSFVVLIVTTTFQTVNTGSPIAAFVIAAIGAGAIASMLLGGSGTFLKLATMAGGLAPGERGAAPEGVMASFGIYSAEKQPVDPRNAVAMTKPKAAAPVLRPAAQASPAPTRAAVKVPAGRTLSPAAPKPQQQARVVRKRPRGAIGEWDQSQG